MCATQMYILPVIGTERGQASNADNSMEHLVTFIYSFCYLHTATYCLQSLVVTGQGRDRWATAGLLLWAGNNEQDQRPTYFICGNPHSDNAAAAEPADCVSHHAEANAELVLCC